MVQDYEHEGPHYGFKEKFAGPKENSIAIERLICSPDRPKFGCTPNAIIDSRVIFKCYVCLRLKKEILLIRKYTTHQQNNETNFCFLFLVIKLMPALISVVGRR